MSDDVTQPGFTGHFGRLLERLDERAHLTPARLEISRVEGEWVAQVIADPLYQPVVGRGPFIEYALAQLSECKIDWRRVRR